MSLLPVKATEQSTRIIVCFLVILRVTRKNTSRNSPIKKLQQNPRNRLLLPEKHNLKKSANKSLPKNKQPQSLRDKLPKLKKHNFNKSVNKNSPGSKPLQKPRSKRL